MNLTDLNSWLQSQTTTLDDIIAKAGRAFHKDALQVRSAEQFGFDLAECQTESWHLYDGKDLCYDRPNTPFVYSLWYHARRVNTFLTHFASALFSAQDQKYLEIFDLGAGTGAVQWAVGLVYHKMKLEGSHFPQIKIINVDTSPFMLHYGKDYLWKYFLEAYPHCKEFSDNIDYELNSWSNKHGKPIGNPWITASYLFDISDASENGEYKKAVLTNFKEIVTAYQPSRFLLLTSMQKQQLLHEVTNELLTTEFIVEHNSNQNLLLQGALAQVSRFRSELMATYSPFLTTSREQSIGRAASWHDRSFVGTMITRRQASFFGTSPVSEGLRLHDGSIKVRRDVELNEAQKKAARNITQPTVIIGPAGCGKSIVITERIKNICEELEYEADLRILLTTFNKELLSQLKEWLLDLLDPGQIIKVETNAAGCKIFFCGNETEIENIRILHFDMLPKYLGDVPGWGLVSKDQHRRILLDIITTVKATNGITDGQYSEVLNPDFLSEEYDRVIYGLQVGISESKEDYMAVSRKGRGMKLDRRRRELVLQSLRLYAIKLYNGKVPSFTIRRQLFLNKLLNGEIDIKFDYVVVDEFQDCTQADFEIFFQLLRTPNGLIISGDLAQAVHLGKTANPEALRQAIRSDRAMANLSWHFLDGSYRLPFRVCEAIRKISEHIHLSFKKSPAARILTPYKGAPPGARPIVVVGKDCKTISGKINSILQQYSVYNIKEKCILEKDFPFEESLDVETDTVLRLKGLEKHCVVWSTRAGVENEKEKFEFVYTILSRTSSILIIALFNGTESKDQTHEMFKDAIGLLNKERLIFWDKETKDQFPKFCKELQPADANED